MCVVPFYITILNELPYHFKYGPQKHHVPTFCKLAHLCRAMFAGDNASNLGGESWYSRRRATTSGMHGWPQPLLLRCIARGGKTWVFVSHYTLSHMIHCHCVVIVSHDTMSSCHPCLTWYLVIMSSLSRMSDIWIGRIHCIIIVMCNLVWSKYWYIQHVWVYEFPAKE